IIARINPAEIACFIPEYMESAYRESVDWPVNEPSALKGRDLLILDGRVKATWLKGQATWLKGEERSGRVFLDQDGRVLLAMIPAGKLENMTTDSLEELLDQACSSLPVEKTAAPVWNYTWELVLQNPEEITSDFAERGLHGIEGRVEEPNAVRGSRDNVYVAPGALIHPMVVLDAAHGPIFIDEGAEIHPFTRIEGPCYIGKKSVLLGAKCREGNSIGPVCRIGGEIEESIVHGYSNKYHDGFLGHAYVGEWVNLGALTTNSDLKNDYSSVSISLDGRNLIDTGSTKVGSLIGDHTKTSIGTLLNTGSYIGAMALIITGGKLLPKFLPSFSWFLQGSVTKGFGRSKLYQTAAMAMGRRGKMWTEAQEAMWDEIFQLTSSARAEAVKKGRRNLASWK
ncbi:MAG TPA: hypothetical protein VMX75_02070, partial [Spirochaetia bacterium]|nr:hypothetical protein [Spirochaetia bacterium]